ncbi:MAG: sigma-70 family RNA polymerase sigma factor [Bacteroidales bacterium]|nr:sigma-70 family RNA polymerase sigma factor [Bacteroidales bacterium]
MELDIHLTDKGKRDYALVQMAIEGSQSAYADLMNNYRDSLYFMLLKMTNNATDAEDMTIEAFGKAFKSIHLYSPKYAFSTWLFRIATNNAIDFIRKKKQGILSIDKSLTGDEKGPNLSQNIDSGALDPEEIFVREQKIELMRQVVDRLKPHYKLLIELRYFKEFSYDEIADEMDLPLGTVKAQLFRAREFLYNIMKNAKENI